RWARAPKSMPSSARPWWPSFPMRASTSSSTWRTRACWSPISGRRNPSTTSSSSPMAGSTGARSISTRASSSPTRSTKGRLCRRWSISATPRPTVRPGSVIWRRRRSSSCSRSRTCRSTMPTTPTPSAPPSTAMSTRRMPISPCSPTPTSAEPGAEWTWAQHDGSRVTRRAVRALARAARSGGNGPARDRAGVGMTQAIASVTAADAFIERAAHTSRRKGVLFYIAGRLGAGVFVLFGAVTVSFLLVHATGNPATVLAGGSLPAAQVHALSVQLGYERPLLSQYGSYIVGVLHGQFGVSFRYGTPAIDSVMTSLPNTLALIGVSLFAALVLSITIAVSSVLSRKGWADRFWRPVVLVLQGIPDFWIALILVLVLAVHLHLLPSLGFAGPKTLIMPCVALTVPMLASFTRLLRASLLDFTNSDVAFALRARGL